MEDKPVTPIELAFTIQDPCGEAALELAHEILQLITNREDNGLCRRIAHEIHYLNSKFPRLP